MKPPIRILIVDDHAMVRFALSEAIQRHPDLILAGYAKKMILCRRAEDARVALD